MSGRPAFQRRFLFGYEPSEVDRALAAYDHRVDQLTQELAAAEAVLREQQAAATARDAEPVEPGDIEFSLPRSLFGYRRSTVQQALVNLHDQLVEHRTERHSLEARLAAAHEELDSWRNRQRQLEAVALRAAEDAERIEREAADDAQRTQDAARRSASAIVESARREAKELLDAAEPEIRRRRQQLARLAALQLQLTHGIRHAMTEFEQDLVQLPDVSADAAPPEEPERIPPEPTATVHDIAPHVQARDSAGLRHQVRVRPLVDYLELARFVRRLLAHPRVEDVFVQNFEGDVADITVHLAEGASLESIIGDLDGADIEPLTGASHGSVLTVRLSVAGSA